MLSSYKQEIIWPDAGGLDASALIPFELGGTMQSPKPTVTVIDLGKMLLHCSREGDTDQVRDLMARGAPFHSDWLGTSALHAAATHNHHDTCDALIKAGISKNARTKVDRTPLHFAVYEGHEDIVRLLLRHECEVDAKDMLRMTPLHWAVEKRYPRIVTELLRYGADPSCRSKFDKTPMSIALASGQSDVHQELVVAKSKIGDPEQKRATDTLMFELGRTGGGGDDDEAAAAVGHRTTDHSMAADMGSPLYTGSGGSDHLAEQDRLNANHMDIDDPISKLPGVIDKDCKSVDTTMKILKEHGIAMLDDTDTLLNSALQSGRRLVLSDAGKLILNDPKYKQHMQPRPTAAHATATTSAQAASANFAPAGLMKSTISPQKRQTILSTIAAQHKLHHQPTMIATTSNGTNNIRFETMRSKKPAAMFMPSKSTVGGLQQQQQQQQSSLVAGATSMASTSAVASGSQPQLPLKTNKVIKILSAEEFKQMCGANAAAGSTLKKISTESFQKGALKYQTITNSNILTQLTRKKPILNKIKLGSLTQSTKNSMLNEIKITGIKPIGQLQKLVPSTSTTSSSSASSTLPTSYPASGIVIDPDTEYISRLSQNQAKAAAAAVAAAAVANATATAASANNFTAYHRIAPAAVSSIPAAQASSTAGTSTLRLPMGAAEMERQLLELRKQTDELRKQFELSQKQAEEYRLRLEKLERERDEERTAERFRTAYSDT